MITRIALADDHEIFLEGLKSLLVQQSNLEIVGLARSGRGLLEVVSKTRPHVVLLDLMMPRLNGIETARRIAADYPEVKTICLSMHSAPRFVEEALEAGVSGYVLKECAFDEILRAIRAVMTDQTFLCPAVAGILVDTWRSSRVDSDLGAFSVLTDREREVLQLLAEGFSSKEIAGRLNLSVKTVGTHREHIMAKTGIQSIAGLTRYAIAEGLTDLTVSQTRGEATS